MAEILQCLRHGPLIVWESLEVRYAACSIETDEGNAEILPATVLIAAKPNKHADNADAVGSRAQRGHNFAVHRSDSLLP